MSKNRKQEVWNTEVVLAENSPPAGRTGIF